MKSLSISLKTTNFIAFKNQCPFFRDDIVVIMKEVLNLKPDKTIKFLIETKTYIEYSETQELDLFI